MNSREAAALWRTYSGHDPDTVTRLATGSANYVFLIRDGDGSFILRACVPENRGVLSGSVYWLDKLTMLELPIPRLLARRLDDGFPFVVLSYLEGSDLGAVYGELTAEQKRGIAADLWTIQKKVGTLVGPGYGYLPAMDDSNHKPTWKAVVQTHLARSRSWIRECGIFDESFVDRVEAWLPEFDGYFAGIEPRAFFDDATTKNVLVHEGRFSGLVDLDWLCFGDRLYTIALTRMSLLESGGSLDYIDFLTAEEGVIGAQRRVLSFYTLAFCVDFMGGLGMQFNKPEKPTVTVDQKSRLVGLFEAIEKELR